MVREFDLDLIGLNRELNDCTSAGPIDTDAAEEYIKSSYPDNEGRFFNCILHTTLYNHKSLTCHTCSFKDDCKEMLKATARRVYIKRGY
jgi:hypothetical protein